MDASYVLHGNPCKERRVENAISEDMSNLLLIASS